MAVQLLIHRPAPSETEATTRFGGLPLTDAGSTWPRCRTCAGPMQFLGQLRAGERLLSLFMCQNDPGCCDEWSADEGGNAVLIQPVTASTLLEPPAEGATLRGVAHGAAIEEMPGDDYDEAREAWAAAHDGQRREVLGQLSGEPSWIQGDETPNCASCGARMRFIAQLEEGPDWQTAMNFGSGCAYVFDCSCEAPVGKLLWQCT